MSVAQQAGRAIPAQFDLPFPFVVYCFNGDVRCQFSQSRSLPARRAPPAHVAADDRTHRHRPGDRLRSRTTAGFSARMAWRRLDDSGTVCLALGMVAGIGWCATRIPTPLEAALEADRQLQWADLLGTAFLLRANPNDPWQRMVLVTADRRCRGLSPSSILLRRVSPRAWSGIAPVLAVTLTLSALIGSPATSLARDARLLHVRTRRRAALRAANRYSHPCRCATSALPLRRPKVRIRQRIAPPPPGSHEPGNRNRQPQCRCPKLGFKRRAGWRTRPNQTRLS